MNLQELRDLVDMEDIPHPTVPEYKEHHESIKKILVAIDGMIADEAMPKNEFELAGFTKEQRSKLQEVSRKFGVAPHYLIDAFRGFVPIVNIADIVETREAINRLKGHLDYLKLEPASYKKLIPAMKLAIQCMEVAMHAN